MARGCAPGHAVRAKPSGSGQGWRAQEFVGMWTECDWKKGRRECVDLGDGCEIREWEGGSSFFYPMGS